MAAHGVSATSQREVPPGASGVARLGRGGVLRILRGASPSVTRWLMTLGWASVRECTPSDGPRSALRRLRKPQDAMDECVALLTLEPRRVRPGAIGDRLVVEEVLRLLGVRQGTAIAAPFSASSSSASLPLRPARSPRPARRSPRRWRRRSGYRRPPCSRSGHVAADPYLAGLPDPLEIPPVRPANP
jgi:hypothetical protein